MRISDWSSDVCSSDLSHRGERRDAGTPDVHAGHRRRRQFLARRAQDRVRERPVGRPANLCDEYRRIEPAADQLWRWPRRDPRMVAARRSEEHTSELQSLMRISYAVFCLKKKNNTT